MTTRPPADSDAAARARIEASLGESLLVEAAAGTGKTTELVTRVVNVLGQGLTTVDRIVAVTFTRKAAGELQLRLRQKLDEARLSSEEEAERERLEQAIERLEEAQIGTIHSFCAEVLRERPVEARIDPGFEEMDQSAAEALYDRAFRVWVERRLDDMPPGLRRALSRLGTAPGFGIGTPLDRIRRAGRQLAEWRDFPAPWRREPFDREHVIDELTDRVLRLASLCRRARDPRDTLRLALEPVETLGEWIARTEAAAGGRDYDALEARLILDLRPLGRDRRKGRGEPFAEAAPRSEVLAERQELIERLEDFRRWADADLAATLKPELDEVTRDYEELKRRTGRLDFLDLLLRARDLVRSDATVRAHLQRRFTHLFVDEFQDTDPLQAELLLLLAADDPEESDWRRVRPAPGKLFLVGDPKQSIYRFRRADVVLYQEIQGRLQAGGAGVVNLSRSFRSVRPIQQAVNAAFAAQFEADGPSGQPGYVALDEHRPAPEGRPAVVVLPVPRPYSSWGNITAGAIEESLPDAVAAFVDWLIRGSGWTVEEDRRQVAIEARHVCLQFRRFASWKGDISRGYTRAFEARGIPHLLVGGRSLHQREEVETVRTALVAIEWPDDELSVFATLKGPLFAIPDDLLLRFRLEVGTLHPFRPLGDEPEEPFAPVREALDLVSRLHRHRNRIPIAATVDRLLRATRAHAGFAIRPAGNQVLANVQQLIDRARGFEQGGGLSFRGFVEQLLEEAEELSSRPSPPIDEGATGVRLMTVHSAKGLEFPVVILADPTAKAARPDPDGAIDAEAGLCARRLLGWSPWELLDAEKTEAARDRAEAVRVAYVAATRARDLLVVPAVGDEPYRSGWLASLSPALYPAAGEFRQSREAPGCPEFGAASVLDPPPELLQQGETSVRPGLHRPQRGEHEVVWWDPAVLELDAPSRFGLVQEQILAEDDDLAAAEAGLARYRQWAEAGERLLEKGAEPSERPLRVTELERPPEPPPEPASVVRLPRSADRPAGRRFGTLVHSVLRDAEPDAGRGAIEAVAAFHARQLEAAPEETAAAIEATARALAHPAVAAAAGADAVHRETPFLLRLDDGRLLQGVLDLAYRRNGAWTVVDFKTDLDEQSVPQRYLRQLAWYTRALERLTGETVAGVLLGV